MKHLSYLFLILIFFISCKETKKVNTEINQIENQDIFRHSINNIQGELAYNVTSSKNKNFICKIKLQEEASLLSISYIKKSLKNEDFDNDGNIESIFATITEGDGETYNFNINYIDDCKLLSIPIELSYQNENNTKQINTNFIKLINLKTDINNDVKIEIKKYFNHIFQNEQSFDYENIENSKKIFK